MRMDAATVTIVGRAVTAPTRSTTSAGDRVSFRVVSTERRYDQESKEWVDGDEFGVGRGLLAAPCRQGRRHDSRRRPDRGDRPDQHAQVRRATAPPSTSPTSARTWSPSTSRGWAAASCAGGTRRTGGPSAQRGWRPGRRAAEPAFGHSGTAGAGVAPPAEPGDGAPDGLIVESQTAAGPAAGRRQPRRTRSTTAGRAGLHARRRRSTCPGQSRPRRAGRHAESRTRLQSGTRARAECNA